MNSMLFSVHIIFSLPLFCFCNLCQLLHQRVYCLIIFYLHHFAYHHHQSSSSLLPISSSLLPQPPAVSSLPASSPKYQRLTSFSELFLITSCRHFPPSKILHPPHDFSFPTITNNNNSSINTTTFNVILTTDASTNFFLLDWHHHHHHHPRFSPSLSPLLFICFITPPPLFSRLSTAVCFLPPPHHCHPALILSDSLTSFPTTPTTFEIIATMTTTTTNSIQVPTITTYCLLPTPSPNTHTHTLTTTIITLPTPSPLSRGADDHDWPLQLTVSQSGQPITGTHLPNS